MVCACNHGTGETEGGSLELVYYLKQPDPGAPGSMRETLPQRIQVCIHILNTDSVSCYGDQSVSSTLKCCSAHLPKYISQSHL